MRLVLPCPCSTNTTEDGTKKIISTKSAISAMQQSVLNMSPSSKMGIQTSNTFFAAAIKVTILGVL